MSPTLFPYPHACQLKNDGVWVEKVGPFLPGPCLFFPHALFPHPQPTKKRLRSGERKKGVEEERKDDGVTPPAAWPPPLPAPTHPRGGGAQAAWPGLYSPAGRKEPLRVAARLGRGQLARLTKRLRRASERPAPRHRGPLSLPLSIQRYAQGRERGREKKRAPTSRAPPSPFFIRKNGYGTGE